MFDDDLDDREEMDLEQEDFDDLAEEEEDLDGGFSVLSAIVRSLTRGGR